MSHKGNEKRRIEQKYFSQNVLQCSIIHKKNATTLNGRQRPKAYV
jgi:hypothetical protein